MRAKVLDLLERFISCESDTNDKTVSKHLGNNVLHDGFIAGIDAGAAILSTEADNAGSGSRADDITEHFAELCKLSLNTIASVQLKIGSTAEMATHAVQSGVLHRVDFFNQHAKSEVLVRVHELALGFGGWVCRFMALLCSHIERGRKGGGGTGTR